MGRLVGATGPQNMASFLRRLAMFHSKIVISRIRATAVRHSYMEATVPPNVPRACDQSTHRPQFRSPSKRKAMYAIPGRSYSQPPATIWTRFHAVAVGVGGDAGTHSSHMHKVTCGVASIFSFCHHTHLQIFRYVHTTE